MMFDREGGGAAVSFVCGKGAWLHVQQKTEPTIRWVPFPVVGFDTHAPPPHPPTFIPPPLPDDFARQNVLNERRDGVFLHGAGHRLLVPKAQRQV